MAIAARKGLVALETTAPPTPSAGQRLLYPKADGWYEKDSAGVETKVGPSAGGAANALTTDTPQTLTTAGVKQFPPNTLLMRSADGTQTAEPYSDINAPLTLERTLGAAPVGSPVAGESFEWTTDGKSLDMKASDGTVTRIGPSAGGGGASGAELAATTEYTTTTPTLPVTGLKLFVRHRARRLPAFVGPTGLDSQLQPALYSNRVNRLSASQGAAAPLADAMPLPTAYTTASAAATPYDAASFYTSMQRLRYPAPTTANSFAGFRTTGLWHMSQTANKGGFFWVFRFGINAGTATGRAFVGLSSTVTNMTNVDPSTLFNLCGFQIRSAGTNWEFVANAATGTAQTVDLGANFPARTYATNFFEFRLFSPSGNGTSPIALFWSAQRLNDGALVQGTATAQIPAANTPLAHHAWYNNVTATIVGLDFQSLYVETDN